MSGFPSICDGDDQIIERPNVDSNIINESGRKRGSGQTDFEDIKTPKKPTVTKKMSTRYITKQNPSSCVLARRHFRRPISCDPPCQSQSMYSYEDELLRLLDSVIEDALNGAKMKYINTALTIPVYKVDNIKSRLNKADTEKLETWETIHRNDNVIVRSNLINSDNENNDFKPPEDDLEYYYICFYVKNTLADINLAENDTFSDATEESENCRKKNFRVCLVLNKELLFFKN
ncbi:hypothetical protein B5S32_g3868 [[Candida] boidinii]|nr:hypothetical protein B5S29_g5507 [[Candida] boidinii]OWB79638.1 hypothetical protein B5S32_g3868 [[Candida] boidinii]